MAEATLSTKNQIVIPREARAALGLEAGDKLLVVVHGDSVVVLQKPRSFRRAIEGLGKPHPKGYLRKERQSWDKRS